MENTNLMNGTLGATSFSSASDIESTQWTKYHTLQAHGFAAEDWNALMDKLCGRSVDKVGLSNELNGADRIVNGVKIQSKYCSSSYKSVSNAFDENGLYRYPGMKLEVPKGQGEDAVRYMEQRIRNGQVPGVSDPALAGEMVVEGNCTYDQAVKIAKAGNIESLKFDAANQLVTCALAIGISFIVGYAAARVGGLSREVALKQAVSQALKVGVTTMAAGVAVQQILRTQVGRDMAAVATRSAKKIVDGIMSTPAGRTVIERMMAGVLGKAAAQNAARSACVKLLRSNFFTSTAIATATAVPDIVKACSGRKSWKQVGKNAVVNVAGIGGGSAGWWAGAAAGSCVLPGVGTVIGGMIGAIGGGLAASVGAKKSLDCFVDDDSVKCIKMVEDAVVNLCMAYDTKEEELDSIMRRIRSENVLKESFFEKMYRTGGSGMDNARMRAFATSQLRQYFV